MTRGYGAMGRKVRNILLAGSAIGCLLVTTATAAAQDKRRFDIPAADAPAAVELLGRQSGLQVFASTRDLRGVRTKAVRGEYAPLEAVRRMVEGTGLEVVTTGSGTVTIRRMNEAQGQDGGPVAVSSGLEEEAALVEEVQVTGSRIKRAGFDTLQPAISTSGEELEARGVANIGEALESTPGFGVSAANPQANQTPFGVGQTYVDFFGLGSQRTLTLVNGRRVVSSNAATGFTLVQPGQQVDLGLIPIDLVDRIETVAIGGAPIYGSDAIAGTINVILKDSFQGVKARAQYGITDRGDGQSGLYSVTVGANFAEDRGNVVASLQYTQQDGLQESARDYLNVRPFLVANPANTGPNDGISAQRLLPDRVLFTLTDGGIPVPNTPLGQLPPGTRGSLLPGFPNGVYIFDTQGRPLQFGAGGTLVPLNVGVGPTTALGGAPGLADALITASGGDGIRGEYSNLISQTERLIFSGASRYRLTSRMEVFGEYAYAHARGEERELVSPYGVIFAGSNIPISVNNAFLTPADRQTLINNGVATFGLAKNLDSLYANQPAFTEQDFHRAVVGLRGDFDFAGQTFDWDVSANYGRTEATTHLNMVNNTRLLLAADAVAGPGNTVVCASGAAGCVPINLFGVGNASPAAIAYVTDIGSAVSTNEQKVFTANIGGPLSLGLAAPISFNLGVERREERAVFAPDATLAAGSLFLPAVRAVRGGYQTNEIYGEFLAPLVTAEQDLPFAKSLILEGSARYVDNSRAGADTTWSLGGRFAPRLPGWGDGLVIRGVYTKAFRAPAVTELFLPASSGRATANDPCSAQFYQAGPNPAVRTANCTAALAPLGFSSPALFNSIVVSNGRNGIVATGNPNLRNEKAKSWSVGFVYQPTEAPRFRFSADWVDVHIDDGIQSLSLVQLLQGCYDNPGYPVVDVCQRFTRGVGADAGQITGFQSGYINTASTDFAGFLANAEYGFDLGDLGALRLSGKLFHISEYTNLVFAGFTQPLKGTVGYPEYEASLDVRWKRGPLDLGWRTNWTSATKIDITATYENSPVNDVEAYYVSDATIGFDVNERIRAQAVVTNIFDVEPPFATLVAANDVRRRSYDRLGRRYVFTLTAKF